MQQNKLKPLNSSQSPKENDLIALAKSLPKSVCKPSSNNQPYEGQNRNQNLFSTEYPTAYPNNENSKNNKTESRQLQNTKGYSFSNFGRIGLGSNIDSTSDRNSDLTANRIPSQNTYFSGNYSQSTLNSGPSIPSQAPCYNTLKGINREVGMRELNSQFEIGNNPQRGKMMHNKGASSEMNPRIMQSSFLKYNESSKNNDIPRSDINQSIPMNLKNLNEVNMKGCGQQGNKRLMISANTIKQPGSPQKCGPNNYSLNNFKGEALLYQSSKQYQSLPFDNSNFKMIPPYNNTQQYYDAYYNHPDLNNCSYYSSNLPQHSVKYSEGTISSKVSAGSTKGGLNLNIEDLLIQEEKIIDIIEDLTSDPSNSCYELWNFYGSSSVSGKFENFFKDECSKKIIFEHTALEFISIIICYDCQKHGIFPKFEKQFTQVFNYIHQNFLLFADYLLTKISKSCLSNIWVNKLSSLVKSSLKLAPNNKTENVRVILYHNENISNILKSILKEHTGTEPYLDLLFNFLFNPSSVSLLILSDIFRNKVLKFSVSVIF